MFTAVFNTALNTYRQSKMHCVTLHYSGILNNEYLPCLLPTHAAGSYSLVTMSFRYASPFFMKKYMFAAVFNTALKTNRQSKTALRMEERGEERTTEWDKDGEGETEMLPILMHSGKLLNSTDQGFVRQRLIFVDERCEWMDGSARISFLPCQMFVLM